MMLVLVLASLTAEAGPAAETVSVPLPLADPPVLLGDGGIAVLPFAAGRDLAGLTAAAVRVRGSGDFIRSLCWNFGDFGGGQWTYREDAGLTATVAVDGTVIATATLRFAQADHPDFVGVNFDSTLVFAAGDWSALADGNGTVVLGGLDCHHAASYPEACACEPSAGVLEAAFVATLDGDLPAAPAAWGALKARFR
ncbi:MAG: hypothetical protein ABR506_02670 [Candidatus Krumholzibacteriia bacterium]